jgi:hypothetical protein
VILPQSSDLSEVPGPVVVNYVEKEEDVTEFRLNCNPVGASWAVGTRHY